MGWIPNFLRRKNIASEIQQDSPQTATQRGALKPSLITSDNPIKCSTEDELGRSKPAETFARQIMSLDAREGLVVGVLGPWGSGKTSFVNLVRNYLQEMGGAVLEFNPWMFSGAEQLVDAFFAEISSQLKLRREFSEIALLVDQYAESFSVLKWVPFVGPWLERGHGMARIISKIFGRKQGGMRDRRRKVQEELAKLETPIVVILDDIDRLTSSEIREVFKVVRLTASFPNVVYLLAFDRKRVEDALGEQGVPGRDYLEKILQVAVDLPSVPGSVLTAQVFKSIDLALSGLADPGPFETERWPDVFFEIIRPLIRNMRDVRRFVAAIRGAVEGLGGQVAIVDVMAIEAIRVFLPDVFARVKERPEVLTNISDRFGAQLGLDDPAGAVEKLIQAAGDRSEVVRKLISHIFPAAARHVDGAQYDAEEERRWLVQRRIAHGEVLHFYLERTMGDRFVAFLEAETAWPLMSNRDALLAYLQSVDPDRLVDVVSSFETYERAFTAEHAVPGTVALLTLLPGVPERDRGMYALDATMTFRRVVYRLLRALPGPAEVQAAISQILPQLRSLESKRVLIEIVGHREGTGHRLITMEAAEALEKEWLAQVRAARPEELIGDRKLLWTLLAAKRQSNPDEPRLAIPDSPHFSQALLFSARSEVLSHTVGSRHVRRSPRLAWDALLELLDGEAELAERISKLRVSAPEGIGDVLDLAERYLSGWRPTNPADD